MTLHPHVDVEEMFARIDLAPGVTIKDSFATLDLTPHGFDVLLRGHWYQGDFGQKGDIEWFTARS